MSIAPLGADSDTDLFQSSKVIAPDWLFLPPTIATGYGCARRCDVELAVVRRVADRDDLGALVRGRAVVGELAVPGADDGEEPRKARERGE